MLHPYRANIQIVPDDSVEPAWIRRMLCAQSIAGMFRVGSDSSGQRRQYLPVAAKAKDLKTSNTVVLSTKDFCRMRNIKNREGGIIVIDKRKYQTGKTSNEQF